jgi:hypothetical protein
VRHELEKAGIIILDSRAARKVCPDFHTMVRDKCMSLTCFKLTLGNHPNRLVRSLYHQVNKLCVTALLIEVAWLELPLTTGVLENVHKFRFIIYPQRPGDALEHAQQLHNSAKAVPNEAVDLGKLALCKCMHLSLSCMIFARIVNHQAYRFA